jgi:pyruvate/2-oxoglutarate dehydrogenase complex dihydrolipoamide acyltransferase (E2) component
LQHASIPDGRMLIRFQVDLAKFLRYLEICRLETSTEITVTHIAAKAVAIALSDIPSLNGHVIGGDFYQSRSSGIDIGISFELTESETVVLKLENVEAKPIDYIASEVQNRTQELREDKSPSNTRKARLLGLLPGGMSIYVRQIFNALGGKYGISIPLLGIVGFPHGVAMVVTLPSKEASDHEIDLAMISNMTDSSTPIVVTIGGVRLVPTLDQDRKMGSSHVLNVAVSIDNNAGSLAEGKRFASKLQQLMNTPALLDKADRRAAVSKQDEKLAEEKAAARLSALKKK